MLSVHGCRVDKSGPAASPQPSTGGLAYWSVPPGLHGPRETNEGDAAILRAYDALQRGLHEAGLPQTADRTGEARNGVDPGGDSNCSCVCILANPAHCMSLLTEGGRRSPGDLLLCLSPLWLERTAPVNPTTTTTTTTTTGGDVTSNPNAEPTTDTKADPEPELGPKSSPSSQQGETQPPQAPPVLPHAPSPPPPLPPSTGWGLAVRRAIAFCEGGRSYLDAFSPPRRVTYFLNLLGPTLGPGPGPAPQLSWPDAQSRQESPSQPIGPSQSQIQGQIQGQGQASAQHQTAPAGPAVGVTGGGGGWAVAPPVSLEAGLDCPRGSSPELAALVNDALLMRIVIGTSGGVRVPDTLAFVLRPSVRYDVGDSALPLRVVALGSAGGQQSRLREAVCDFLNHDSMARLRKVVVKPWGLQARRVLSASGRPCSSYYAPADSDGVLAAVSALVDTLADGEGVLVEAYQPTVRPVATVGPLEDAGAAGRGGWTVPRPELALRVCAIVCRTPENQPLVSQLLCVVGRASRPVCHVSSSPPLTLETALAEWGFSDAALRRSAAAALARDAQRAAAAIMDYESTLSAEQRGGARAQTDILGVDLVLTRSNGLLVPVVLGVNQRSCLAVCGAFEAASPQSAGEAVGPFVQTMLHRSQAFCMAGMDILVIGASGSSKKFVWQLAEELGIRIHLVDPSPHHFAATMVASFITYDYVEHRRDEEHARCIAAEVRARGLRPHGCLAFWEECIVLAAAVGRLLGLRGNSVEAMRRVKQKSSTHQHLAASPSASAYAVRSLPVHTLGDVDEAARSLSFPCVLKLEYGAGAVGARLVQDARECRAHLERVSRDLRQDSDFPGIGLGFGNAMLLMEYVEGSEHDVDLVMFGGRLVEAFVSDNGPTGLPRFTETAAAMPSCLPADRCRQLVAAAHRCCAACGLADGVFNVELKLTPLGPKLIEINGRMGGFYLRDWIREVHSVDILLATFAAACGLRPAARALPARSHLVGVMCVASLHAKALEGSASPAVLGALHEEGVLRFNMLMDDDTNQQQLAEYEEPVCNVACAADSKRAAMARLVDLCRVLGIDSKEYPVAHFLSHFS